MTPVRRYGSLLRRGVLLLWLACAGGVGRVPAQDDIATEAAFKAAYLYNFLQFIEWPETAFRDSGAPIVVGILNQEPLSNSLERIVQGERIGGRAIAVRRLREIEDIADCHVFYIPKTEKRNIWRALTAVDGMHVLTIGETEGFAEEGGAINFFLQDNKLRFEINPEVLKKSHLTASSKLLRLAKIVDVPGRW